MSSKRSDIDANELSNSSKKIDLGDKTFKNAIYSV